MFCKQCGTQNDDSASVCVKCGEVFQQSGGYVPVQTVSNYLVFSILTTILCCLPLGIPAIIFSSQVNQKLQLGDTIGAIESSKNAKVFCWLAAGIGLLHILGWIGYFIMIAIIAASEGY